jgi:hypothetical protein
LLDLATRDARTVTNDSAMHLPALAQGVDVDAKGSHHALQRTMIAASSGKTASFGVCCSEWRARRDSNS